MKKLLFLAAVLTTGLSACSGKSVSPDQAAPPINLICLNGL